MKWFLMALKKYATFSGRSQRKEIEGFYTFSILFFIIAFILDRATGLYSKENSIGLFSGTLVLALFIPNLALIARRLHDTGRSAWWLLLYPMTIIGWFIVMGLCCLKGTPGDNAYGPNPAEEGSDGNSPAQKRTAAAPTAKAVSHDYLAELEKLADLKAKGILSEEEFQQRKSQIMGR